MTIALAVRNIVFPMALVGVFALAGCQGTSTAVSSYGGSTLNDAGVRTVTVAAPSFDRDDTSTTTMRVPVPQTPAQIAAQKAAKEQ
ncbi:MAG: hypothetical protein AAFO70_01250, partial [Pseudomonadota bacterium]